MRTGLGSEVPRRGEGGPSPEDEAQAHRDGGGRRGAGPHVHQHPEHDGRQVRVFSILTFRAGHTGRPPVI